MAARVVTAAQVARIKELRAEGLTAGPIGVRLGIPESTVRNWWNAAPCPNCGTPVDRSNGARHGAVVCEDCAPLVYWPEYSITRRGRGPVIEEVLAFCAKPRTYSEIRDHTAKTDGRISGLLRRGVNQGLLERIGHGLYRTAKPAPVSAADPSPHKERAQSVA